MAYRSETTCDLCGKVVIRDSTAGPREQEKSFVSFDGDSYFAMPLPIIDGKIRS